MFASLTLDGAADRISFEVYLREVLVPTLVPGQIIILDNLAVHKQAALRQLIHAAGCRVLFLPSYSPDFNPIEMAFAEIKAFLRRTAARTRERLEVEIVPSINLVTAQHAVGYFRHCGYQAFAR